MSYGLILQKLPAVSGVYPYQLQAHGLGGSYYQGYAADVSSLVNALATAMWDSGFRLISGITQSDQRTLLTFAALSAGIGTGTGRCRFVAVQEP